jgi:hypothetical protein
MTTDGTSINQLMELFLMSRKRGEWVKLSMESKDGRDLMTFSLGNPAGAPAGLPQAWTPGSKSPWTWPQPPWTRPKRRKTPSQWKRDEKRRQAFISRKVSSTESKKEANTSEDKKVEVIIENPVDEIELEEIQKEVRNETQVNELFKIEGEYKNPNFKPWAVVEPDKEVKTLWDKIKMDNKIKGIEEIGEGSTCFEHCFEFWGTWKVQKEGITIDFLKKSENWPKGIKITEVKPA